MEYTNCRICDSDRALTGTKLCDGCWEVDRRLSGFLRHPNGVKAVCEELSEADHRFACLKNLAADEPVFILKAKDKLASAVVRIWEVLARAAGTDSAKLGAAVDTADWMDTWGRDFGTKVPD